MNKFVSHHTDPNTAGRSDVITTWFLGFMLFVVLVTVVYVRVHFLEIPLQRDEGEYAYIGQLILRGIPPYGSAYSMKMPGVYAAYAAILGLCGQTLWGIHLGLLIINVLTVIVLVMLGRSLMDTATGIYAGTTFAVLSLSPSVQGISANAEHFVILCALSGLLVLIDGLRAANRGRLFWAGFLLGSACLMKQHGIAFVAFAGLIFLHEKLKISARDRRQFTSHLAALVLGGCTPVILMCLVLWIEGVFGKFWFWTFVYAWKYVSGGSYTTTIPEITAIWSTIFAAAPLVWILVAFGLTSLLWDDKNRVRLAFFGSLAVLSVGAVCPGLIFRPHYFILLLPAVSLIAAIGAAAAGRLTARIGFRSIEIGVAALIIIVAIAHSIYIQRSFYFETSPEKASRLVYGPNPFPESLPIAKYIVKHSTPHDRIAVLGSEPQIYFYTRRMAATSYLYTYPLMENQQFAEEMQREMIRQIESAAPKFLIYVHIWDSWCYTPQSNKAIFRWLKRYLSERYELVGIADMISLKETHYWWNTDWKSYSPKSQYYLATYRRKPAP
jgi:4-amino-4-deoxy-L-arabinose transferase-like glycosyltransferase